jgi:hypothetical protein
MTPALEIGQRTTRGKEESGRQTTTVGGPVAKVPFFQMVQISLLSVLIYYTRCECDILKVLFLKNDWSLSIECVKHGNDLR